VTLYPAVSSIPEIIARLQALPRPKSIEARDDEELPEREGL
jgi:antitoxin VapB